MTGAGQGIGLRVAERASEEGAKVVLVDRASHIHEIASSLVKQGKEAIAVEADLETWEGAVGAVENAKAISATLTSSSTMWEVRSGPSLMSTINLQR